MSSVVRQNSLFVAEDWRRVYEAISNVDFTAYDQNTLRSAIVEHLQQNYSETFNDWIASSEFVMILDTLTYLSQNISYRIDLNNRDNILELARRKESILRLAFNLAYNVSRNTAAKGDMKLTSIRTNQRLLDFDGRPIRGNVLWNDASDPDWFDKWTIIMDAAFDSRTKWGNPLRSFSKNRTTLNTYRFNSPAPLVGSYPVTATTNTYGSLAIDLINAVINETSGQVEELTPERFSSYHVLYKSDGLGAGSKGTGFFLPYKQGKIQSVDLNLIDVTPNTTIDIDVPNINNADVWLVELNEDGTNKAEWTKTDGLFNESLAYAPRASSRKIFEVYTLNNDRIKLRFGDGKFSEIPNGQFRCWFRVSSPSAPLLKISDMVNRSITIPYVSQAETFRLTLTMSAVQDSTQGARSETELDIKRRASKVYYTQNRMVTGEDYNSFPLKDNNILKLKAVNRTFAGQGNTAALNDPTGSYNNVSITGNDGHLYLEPHRSTRPATFNSDLQSSESFIDQYIAPLLASEDKQILHYKTQPPIPVQDIRFLKTSTVQKRAKGKFDPIPSADILDYLKPDALLKFQTGELSRLERILPDSLSLSDSVSLKNSVNFDQSFVTSITPAMRRTLSSSEKANVIRALTFKRPFAIRWDSRGFWDIILQNNIDSASEYSRQYAGDLTGANRDASWILWLEYSVGSNDTDIWTITDRGIWLNFESESSVNFYHVDDKPVVDLRTLQVKRDEIIITTANESKDSLYRKGIQDSFSTIPVFGVQIIEGNGVKKLFRLNTSQVPSNHVFLYQDEVLDKTTVWQLKTEGNATYIEFNVAPELGEYFQVKIDPFLIQNTPKFFKYAPETDTDTFNLNNDNYYLSNSFVFVDGLLETTQSYGIYNTNEVKRIKLYRDVSNLTVNTLTGGEPIWISHSFVSEENQTIFDLKMVSPLSLVFREGVLVTSGYAVNTDLSDANRIIFDEEFEEGVNIEVRSLVSSATVDVDYVEAVATDEQVVVQVPSTANRNNVLLWVDGIYQSDVTYDENLSAFILNAGLVAGQEIVYIHTSFAASLTSSADLMFRTYSGDNIQLQKEPVSFRVFSRLRYDDGYTNSKGLRITNVDEDYNGSSDNPYNFGTLVLTDGTDLVLRRRILIDGLYGWVPLSETTIPKGTIHSLKYQFEVDTDIPNDDSVDEGHIHYDRTTDTWMKATNGVWTEITDVENYGALVGRDKMNFVWNHYTSDDFRIDLAQTNIHDMYVITSGYDEAVRNWLEFGGTLPTPETSDLLKATFEPFEDYKMVSDTLVWRSGRYKFLFGNAAQSELRGKFLVVKAPGSTQNDNDVKIAVLNAINRFFDVEFWDFGERFYFTELAAFIHSELNGVIQSVVVVSTSGNSFGQLFEARCEPDELFLSVATIADIEIVDSLNDSRLNRS